MTTRAHLDKQIAELAGRGVSVIEDPKEKTIKFEIPAQLLVSLSDKKLYSLMQAAHKIELVFISMGYSVIANGETVAGPQRADLARGANET